MEFGLCRSARAAGAGVRPLAQDHPEDAGVYGAAGVSAKEPVLLKAFVWEVVIARGSEVIARHRRSYGREEMIFDPLHYLALLEQKTNASDQAAPLEGWELPAEFVELRRQMEARLGKRGRREYMQVLRLLETFPLGEVSAAIRQAQLLQAISFDAVKHLLLGAIEQRPPKLDLENSTPTCRWRKWR
jgi:hypothetical protein